MFFKCCIEREHVAPVRMEYWTGAEQLWGSWSVLGYIKGIRHGNEPCQPKIIRFGGSQWPTTQ